MPQATESSNAEKSEFKTPENSASITNETAKRSCDVLLNNFQIKKKRYRVLLNDDHIVWEPWNTKQNNGYGDEKLNAKKESDVEKHELSNKTVYGSSSNVVHIKEIIRIESRDTQSASLCVETQPAGTLENATSQINSADQAEITPSAQYLTIHYAERMVKSPTDCNRWRTKSLTLYNADPYIIAHWHIVLLKKLNENKNRLHIRRMLVFINPYGGRKEGFQTYEKHCKPIFQLAGIDASCVISQRANQILDIIMSHDLAPYDAICCVGGDGTAAEVINGLIFRAMRDHGLDVRQPAYIPKPTLPIGIIPAGSTDTIAYSAHGTADPRTAAIHVVLGQRRGFDICSVRNNRGIVRFCASVFSYGYLGDVAAHSEKYRWMGPKRYEYTGVKAFLSNRAYEAKIRILETVDDENEVQASTSRSNLATESICYANCQRCSSVLSKHNCKVDGSSVTTSNWTLYTEKILEPVLGSDNIVKNIGPAGDASDVVDITSHKTSNISTENCLTKSTINCDSNLQNCLDDNNLKIKEMIKCDNDVKIDDEETVIKTSLDAAKMSSQNSFLFCSTNSTANNRQVDSNSNSSNKMAITPALPSQISNTASRWKTIRGKFFMITCANITCACSRTPNGISRYNHLGDGHLDVILVRKTSILNNLRFALNTMGRNGDIRNLPFVEVFRTRQLKFRAHTENNENLRSSTQPIAEAFSNDAAEKLVSSWNCDGEVLHDLDITITSHCQLIDVFMRGPYSYTNTNNEYQSKFCCCTSSN